jgi:hypothetical protein
MPSAKYVIVTNSFPPETFSIPLPGTLEAPTKANNDALVAKVAELVDAGKMVKGTLGTRSSPDTPGGDTYIPYDIPSPHAGRKIDWNVKYRHWACNTYYTHDTVRNVVIADYPHLRTVPESWKSLRVLKAEHAQEWIDWCLAFGAERACVLSEEEVLAIAPGMELPDDSVIDQHVEGYTQP